MNASLTPAQIERAAHYLRGLQSARQCGARLQPELRPHTCAEGWQIQQRVSALRTSPVHGWKCGLPQEGRFTVAALHAALPSGSRLRAPAGPDGLPRIEPEFAFTLAQDLPPRSMPYETAEVQAAIGSIHLAVEVLGCRYQAAPDAAFPELLADSLWHQTLLLGPPLTHLEAEPTFTLGIKVPGQTERALAARHPDGDPRLPLYWLVEFLRQQGLGLLAGQAVITGSLAGAVPLLFGRQATLSYGTLGELSLTIDAL